ncbi:hypothetical protein T05_1184 [Trichinella murrelli]|uniref:Uncharacterized protein n=1 Tax=Trichinella murrelli TaxID=144512 RepID=A0A0V0TVE8_9BILA|nr:hypothetical protein T05_1184 [Trichinella murrelli]
MGVMYIKASRNRSKRQDFLKGWVVQSRRSLRSLGKRLYIVYITVIYTRCLYIALLTSLRNGNWPNVDSSAEAAAPSSS